MSAAHVRTNSSTHDVILPSFIRRDERGTFIELLHEGPWHTVITGNMRSGAVLGHHYHRRTRMCFFLLRGRAMARVVRTTDGHRRILHLEAGEGAYLEANEAHAIRFLSDAEFLLLKSEPYDPARPDTIPFHVDDDPA